MKSKALTRLLCSTTAAAMIVGLAPVAALATPGAADDREVVSETTLDALSKEELVKSVTSAEGIVDGNDFTSEGSTLKRTDDGISLLAQRPDKFDLRDATFEGVTGNFVTPVKRQNPFATCWTFGASAAAETSYLTEMGLTYEDSKTEAHPKGIDLSEKHLGWFTNTPIATNYFNQQGEGFHSNVDVETNSGGRYTAGTYLNATTLFSTLVGPIDESEDPVLEYHNAAGEYKTGMSQGIEIKEALPTGDWSIPEELRHQANFELEETYYLPSPCSLEPDPATGKTTYAFNPEGVDAIKDQLLAGRAVGIAFYADASLPGQADSGKYLNLDTWAQYTYEPMGFTHAVCVVGYDDTYPKENFLADHQPPADGAFIVKNSWGSATDSDEYNRFKWGIEDSGYFYLSYYDQSISGPEAYDFITDNDDDLTYGKGEGEYQVQEYEYAFLPGETYSKNYDTTTSVANVYEMGIDSVVRTVSTQTRSYDTDVRFDVYRLNDGATEPTDGTLVWSRDEHYPYGGFHRVELETPLIVSAGDKLGVVVTSALPGGQYEAVQNRYPTDVYALASAIDPNDQKWAETRVNVGESFVGNPGKRVDYDDGSYDYADYTWADLSDGIKAGHDEDWAKLNEKGVGEYYDAVKEALATYLEVSKTSADDDPAVEAAKQAYREAWMAYGQAVSAFPDVNEIAGAIYAYDNYPITLTTEAYDPANPPTAAAVEMTRLYNPNNGEHLYTSDADEVERLRDAGWDEEGIGWTAPAKSNTPIYRLYNQYSGEHLLTPLTSERESLLSQGWDDEGVGSYSDSGRTVAMHRLYNPYEDGVNAHLYTSDADEIQKLAGYGYQDEGTCWYALK